LCHDHEKQNVAGYTIRIDKDARNDWGVSVPDLPGCVTTGKTADSALRRIQGAIVLHLRDLREDGINPPLPRPALDRPEVTPRL